MHIPIHEILDRLDEVPSGPVWVHCAGGYRAGIVASLLHGRGHDVVAVDDGFARAVDAGLTATTDRAAGPSRWSGSRPARVPWTHIRPGVSPEEQR